MWTRPDIKNYAKNFLRKYYWKAFVVCLIATLLSGGGSSKSNSNNNSNNDTTYYGNDYNVIEEFEKDLPFEFNNPVFNFATRNFRSPLFMIGGGLLSLMIVASIVLLITIGFAIEVGQSRFFLRGFEDDVSIGKLFSTFNSEEYLPIVKTQFLRGLYNLLWAFLLIIPGIVKHYEYRFVPYILAEKPNLSANDVISRSREITRGHKMDMFVLDLSFIGWYLLGGLFFGIGVFFVDPYSEATYARLYNILSGKDQDSEFNMV
ncbi:MAG: DUF975 family protein [Gudongella sp.]|nr:DUF975 family protein [Gudongella sp.]